MKFLVIDDKDTELERAKDMAAAKGIEIITFNPNHKSDYLEVASWPEEWWDVYLATGGSCYPPEWYDAVRHLKVDGVVTDLMWELSGMSFEEREPKPYTLPATPYGLLVHIEAATVGKPVVICTDEQGHAGQSGVGWVLDYAMMPGPLNVEREKDWGKAFDALAALVGQNAEA